MNLILKSFITVIIYLVCAPFIGGLLNGIDRKISARMQRRVGPPILQPFYDVRKLFNKLPSAVDKRQLFLLMTYLFFVIFAGSMFFAGYDMLLVFFATSTAVIFLLLAASTTHSPYTGVGTMRELVQIMAYEPMELLTAVGFYTATCVGSYDNGASFMVSDFLKTDKPAIVYLPGFFIGFVFILTIKFRKSPFDLSTSHHAHQEVVKGLTAEFSGSMYAITEIAEWYEEVLLYGVVALFFITKNPISYIFALLAILVVFFLEILIDNVSARVKWDLMLKLTWGVILVFSGVNLLVLQYLNKLQELQFLNMFG
ncbi:MAG: NADH-quinone oxidoreductase subunit H [Lachnospiraceae bacterium]|nr:NADH-quinone oxidoreductase subunit H [Lachnospiraceae bacterium]